MSGLTATEALLATSGLHLGFQAVVTVVVYPALASTPADRWHEVHAAHSRRISYVVGPLYVVVAAACVWVLVAGPHTAWAFAALAGHAVAAGTTAAVAAPAHGRLGRDGPSDREVGRLLVADRVRLAATAAAFVAAPLA
ncbi:hypothetical protein AERO_08630 [Aeromicrobium fastidiosum]|uniref:hypothetical protein n=1 Tax=Aeromicrobium fastidiosum TaxID=52699 RepID=UPI0020238681|nr:hypothetical protein [Aeromicrobium fastidiosum]MCL8251448.1 hypothetical protein [Aeromicrobium fastidiosum]